MIKVWATTFYLFLFLSTLTGCFVAAGLFHNQELLQDIIWHLSMITLGIAATALWNLSAAILKVRVIMVLILYLSLTFFGIFYTMLLLITTDFTLAICYYTLICFFTMMVLLGKFYMDLNKNFIFGTLSMLICIIATGLEQINFSLPALYLSEGGVFFILMSLSLLLFNFSITYLLKYNAYVVRVDSDLLYNTSE